MLGTRLQFAKSRGEDRFYDPAKARRAHQSQRAEQIRRVQSDVTPSYSSPAKENLTHRESENRTGSDDPSKHVAVPEFEPVSSPLSNLERFLQSIAPSVPAQYLSKVVLRIGFDFVLKVIQILVFEFILLCIC